MDPSSLVILDRYRRVLYLSNLTGYYLSRASANSNRQQFSTCLFFIIFGYITCLCHHNIVFFCSLFFLQSFFFLQSIFFVVYFFVIYFFVVYFSVVSHFVVQYNNNKFSNPFHSNLGVGLVGCQQGILDDTLDDSAFLAKYSQI